MAIKHKLMQVGKITGDGGVMERRFYIDGKFYDHLAVTPEELAGRIRAKIEQVEQGFDCLLGEHEIVYLKME